MAGRKDCHLKDVKRMTVQEEYEAYKASFGGSENTDAYYVGQLED